MAFTAHLLVIHKCQVKVGKCGSHSSIPLLGPTCLYSVLGAAPPTSHCARGPLRPMLMHTDPTGGPGSRHHALGSWLQVRPESTRGCGQHWRQGQGRCGLLPGLSQGHPQGAEAEDEAGVPIICVLICVPGREGWSCTTLGHTHEPQPGQWQGTECPELGCPSPDARGLRTLVRESAL